MELTAGLPFWLVNDGLLFDYPKLFQSLKTKVVVVGGGISGALAAYHLTEAGIETILVDGRTIGLGSTCASTSLLQYELDIPLYKLQQHIGKTKATRAYIACANAIDRLQEISMRTGYDGFQKNMSLYFAGKKDCGSLLQDEFKARKLAGLKVEMLSRMEVQSYCRINGGAGILSEKAATINAYSFTHHLLQYSIKKGLQVFDRSKVVAIETNGNSVCCTMENDVTIEADFMINAMGYEVVNFLKKDILNFDCTYAFVTEQMDSVEPAWRDGILLWNTDDPYLYLRHTKDNRVMIGGRDERLSNRVTRHLYLQGKIRRLEKDLNELLPGNTLRSEFSWCGTFGKTKDALPYIGPLAGTPQILYSLGMSGNGITFSEVAAEIITATVQGRKHDDAALFEFGR
jgi:glycine/D-amino acid oxidase-like deaminating enzyme